VVNDNEEVEALLEQWREPLGRDFPAYRNHVYRVINLSALQRELSDTELRQVIIAACFHDIAIWLDDTFDYLSPSRHHASAYLQRHGLDEWSGVVGEMIEQHHKITSYQANELVECFRRADWCDVTLGVMRSGIEKHHVRTIRKRFPNAGFHTFLLRRTLRELVTRPWRPLPMMRW